MHFRRRSMVPLLLMGIGVLTLAAGCGDSNPLGRRSISGNVTFDGAPLENGSISFEPLAKDGVGSGAVITDGTFSIPASKGLPPGKYRVRMFAAGENSAPAPEGLPGGAIAPPSVELIPPSWNAQSEHTITVATEGENHFTFSVETSAG